MCICLEERAGRGRVRVTIMMMFRFTWVHFLSSLLLYLNITPPFFFPLTSLSFIQVTYIINVWQMKKRYDYWGLASVELEGDTASFWQLEIWDRAGRQCKTGGDWNRYIYIHISICIYIFVYMYIYICMFVFWVFFCEGLKKKD